MDDLEFAQLSLMDKPPVAKQPKRRQQQRKKSKLRIVNHTNVGFDQLRAKDSMMRYAIDGKRKQKGVLPSAGIMTIPEINVYTEHMLRYYRTNTAVSPMITPMTIARHTISADEYSFLQLFMEFKTTSSKAPSGQAPRVLLQDLRLAEPRVFGTHSYPILALSRKWPAYNREIQVLFAIGEDNTCTILVQSEFGRNQWTTFVNMQTGQIPPRGAYKLNETVDRFKDPTWFPAPVPPPAVAARASDSAMQDEGEEEEDEDDITDTSIRAILRRKNSQQRQKQSTVIPTVVLHPYQQKFVTRMVDRWTVNPNAGQLLADEMGMGKTFSIIMAITKHPRCNDQNSQFLVVVPRGLVSKWKQDIFLFNMRVAEFRNEKDMQWNYSRIVITTPNLLRSQYNKWITLPEYQAERSRMINAEQTRMDSFLRVPPLAIVQSQEAPDMSEAVDEEDDDKDDDEEGVTEEVSSSTAMVQGGDGRIMERKNTNLYQVDWAGMIIDEGHNGLGSSFRRWPRSRQALYIPDFVKPKRLYWYAIRRGFSVVLTGTPFTHSFQDLAAITMWLRTGPSQHPWFWVGVHAWQPAHMNAWVDICIRRRIGNEQIPFGFRVNDETFDMTPNQVQTEARILKTEMIEPATTRPQTGSKTEETKRHVFGSLALLRKNVISLQHIDDPEDRATLGLPQNLTPMMRTERDIVRIVADRLLEHIAKGPLVYSEQRVLVFAEWYETLRFIKERMLLVLDDDPTRFPKGTREEIQEIPIFSGKLGEKERDRVLNDARSKSSLVRHCFLFLTRGAGGLGLDLQHASILYYIGEWYQHNIEDQTIGRVKRPGQTKVVVVHKMVSVGGQQVSIRMREIATRKKEAASIVYRLLGDGVHVGFVDSERTTLREFEKLPRELRIRDFAHAHNPMAKDSGDAFHKINLLRASLLDQFNRWIPEWPEREVKTFYPEGVHRL